MSQEQVESGDHVQGPDNAPVTLIEYLDFQCPYCARAHAALKDLRERLGDKLRLVVRHLPRADHHPFAEMAAEASEAAAAQGKFWQMHDALFEHQAQLNPATLPQVARDVGLDLGRFEDDIGSARFRDKVNGQAQRAKSEGATSTPAIFINGERYHGDSDEASLDKAVQAALQG